MHPVVFQVCTSCCDISKRKVYTHTRAHTLSSGTLFSVLFVLSTYSQSQFPHQPSLLLLRVQADTSSCRLPHFWNLSNLSWESQALSHHPGAYGPLSIYPPSPTHFSFPPPLPSFHLTSKLASCNLLSFLQVLSPFLLYFVSTHLLSTTYFSPYVHPFGLLVWLVLPPLPLGWTEDNQVCQRMTITFCYPRVLGDKGEKY